MPTKRRALLVLLLVAIGVAAFLSGCRSEETIVGKWKLVESSGGIAGGGRRPLPDVTIEFTADGKMMWYENDEVSCSFPYSLGMEKTIFGLDPAPLIYLNDDPFYVYSFPDEDTLVLSENAYDGFSDKYQRV